MDDKQRFTTLESAAIENANQGIKALLLLNGGASIALLAFVGSLATSEHVRPDFLPLVAAAMKSLIWFATGSATAVFCTVIVYLTN